MSKINASIAWLEAQREVFGGATAEKRVECLTAAGARQCRSAAELLSLHESLCFARAYPDDRAVYELSHDLAQRFHERKDVRRLGADLADLGIAGVDLHYRLFWPTAHWLATRFPGHLRIDWDEVEDDSALLRLLPLLFPRIDGVALEEEDLSAQEFLDSFRGSDQTDAEVLVQRFGAARMPDPIRERIFDDLDLPFVLAPGADLPSRTSSGKKVARPSYQIAARSRERPRAAVEWARAPREIRWLSGKKARAWIDEARTAMLTRSRDLDTIAYANPRDVVEVVDVEPGLSFVGFGILPERRFLLEGTYVFLVVQNGVPVGYMQGSGLFGWAEINFNIFEPFRGRDSARFYGRCLAVLRAVMGTETFVLSPYQLGDGNEEAIATGAFWFYYKLGYRHRTRRAKQLVSAEFAKMKRRPKHRTSAPVLRELAENPMFLVLGDEGAHLPYGAVGRAGLFASRYVSQHSTGDRDAAVEELRKAAAKLLGLTPARLKSWSTKQRQALHNWAPLIARLQGVSGWPLAERRALAEVVKARGGLTEADYLQKLSAHVRLEQALMRLVAK